MRALGAILFLVAGSALALPSTETPRHDIEARLTMPAGDLHIVDEIRVDGLEQYAFQLVDWMNIDRVLVDGRPVNAIPDQRDYRLNLPDAGPHTLRFELSGSVPARDSSPFTARGERSSSGPDGVYLPGFEPWLPVGGTGRLRFRLTITVPADQRAVATGSLAHEDKDGATYRATFSSEQPAQPPSLFAGPYVVEEQRHGNLRLRTYFHESLSDLAGAYLEAARGYIDRFAAIIGDYPYSDFHIVSAPLPVGLGFSNLTYVGRRVLPLPFMRTRSLAHEVLHNWWGNSVAVDYATGNWAEGLTTYMADYALAGDLGAEAAREMRVRWLRDYAALPAQRDHAVRAFRSKRHQAAQVVGYNKVAYIFHMLAAEIGESAFKEGIALFYRRHAGQRAGWSDLRAAFEHSAGRDLGWFFAQWLDRTGAPELALGEHQVKRIGNGYRTQIALHQTTPAYRLRVPIRLTTAKGEELHSATVENATTTATFTTSATPLQIHVDPDSDVFRRLGSEETPPIIRDVTLHPATTTLVTARDPDFREPAEALASRLMDTPARFGDLETARASGAPILLITDAATAASTLARLQIGDDNRLPDTVHTAAAWTVRLESGAPALIVSARDTSSLAALVRPLPHYGAQSFVLFNGRQAVRKGVWPIPRGPLFLSLTSQ